MGNLLEQPVTTLFQGVSRQPDPSRLIGQGEEADDVILSVVTGGFSKRFGTIHKAALTVATSDIFVHTYDRDSAEQYIVTIKDDDLFVYDLDGTAKTVAFPDGKGYLNSSDPENGFAAVTIADYTIIANKSVVVALAAAGGGTIKGTKQTWNDLPTSGQVLNDVWRVTGRDTDKFSGYLVVWNGSVWTETVDPTAQNSFDAATMPHILVRESNGTFTFKRATWTSRVAGDTITAPAPDFVGKTITDLSFFQERMALVFSETCFFGQAGDYFNMWPDKALEVKDSDPFGRSAPSAKVNLLKFATPFRKSMFLTSDKAQFEVSSTGSSFTIKTAVIDPSTAYRASPNCRPVTIGDTLYFAASSGGDATVWEYFYNDASVSNTAVDVTKHCLGYLPADIIQMSGDSTVGTIVALSNADRSHLYVYRSFWNNNEKAQSAWARFRLGTGAHICAAHFISGTLYVVVKRGSTVFLESLMITDLGEESSTYQITPDDGKPWSVLLDRRVSLTGTYDAGTGLTTWTIPYVHESDLVGVLNDSWDSRGMTLLLSYPTTITVTAVGDFSANPVIFGKTFEKKFTLSKIYPREGNSGRAITAGRLQLKYLSLDYSNTGEFTVEVIPAGRSQRLFRFVGRILGSASAIIGEMSIARLGTFRVPIRSRGDTVKITIKNATHMPSTITGMSWTGFFNEITRQE